MSHFPSFAPLRALKNLTKQRYSFFGSSSEVSSSSSRVCIYADLLLRLNPATTRASYLLLSTVLKNETHANELNRIVC